MAKKIFCDVCGNEMTYEEVPKHLKNQAVRVEVVGDGNRTLTFEVKVIIQPVADNGEHVDVCGDCRYFLLEKLDSRSVAMRQLALNDVEAARARKASVLP